MTQDNPLQQAVAVLAGGGSLSAEATAAAFGVLMLGEGTQTMRGSAYNSSYCVPARAARDRVGDLDASIVSSTVPQLGPEWRAMAGRYLGHEMLDVGPGLKTGWRCATTTRARSAPTGSSTPSPSGERSGAPSICVDFGTAVNFDVVSPEGEYLGGIIVPGVEISLEALTERGAKLPKIDLAPPRARSASRRSRRSARASSTATPARSTAIVGRIEARWASETSTSSPPAASPAHRAVHGGIDEIDDLLTLTGLRLLHERNTS